MDKPTDDTSLERLLGPADHECPACQEDRASLRALVEKGEPNG